MRSIHQAVKLARPEADLDSAAQLGTLEALIDGGAREIYRELVRSPRLLSRFLLRNALSPFLLFRSRGEAFSAAEPQFRRLMKLSVRCVLAAAKDIFVGSQEKARLLKFKRVDLDEFGLGQLQNLHDLRAQSSHASLKTAHAPRRNTSLKSLISLQKAPPLDALHPRALAAKSGLRKIVLAVPRVERDRAQLSFGRFKAARERRGARLEWFHFKTGFRLAHSTGNFSFTNFDAIVHEFGTQGFLVESLARFLHESINALRANGHSPAHSRLGPADQMSDAGLTRSTR